LVAKKPINDKKEEFKNYPNFHLGFRPIFDKAYCSYEDKDSSFSVEIPMMKKDDDLKVVWYIEIENFMVKLEPSEADFCLV